MEIIYSNDAKKYLARQGKKIALRIHGAIQKYAENPAEFPDVRPMEGYSDGRLRIRTGDYRIIIRHDTDGTLKILLVIEINNRGQIYKHLKRKRK